MNMKGNQFIHAYKSNCDIKFRGLILIEDMHNLRNLKTEANIFLKKSKNCSTVNRPSDLLIKQPKE